ncbi:hypothetical protein IFM58399_09744 [Aspergillus lentulus]|uniref:Lysine-specific metallo-endopeptidase domain-containing protein n=1 Tax=Aspergillus lentulus TaxID=293939 RepID=A0ABQ1B3X1_ASPLE|nr:uncharacterized protein IFM58399_09744 [Aspergillus lentulus]KAF4152019.1 hypothetical protein CNMCM6069_002748 [Aspergillus lentulus]GFF54118.1 hypothetical protein IFM58399_09744 [Aspergillus lentulus]GFF78987.1 hypothetical protein IFM62136_09953 [Aspergillus lentulus]GFF93285.1 hypothetical protein IFM60648_10033 [Aspergillus lentulus]GFF96230.1 hypothetical protein IFM47457_10771 [Aspergillus lentulus]
MILPRLVLSPALLLAIIAIINGHGQLDWAARRELGDMFRYSVDPNAHGGHCSAYGEAKLNALFDDAYVLAGTAIQATLDLEDATAKTTDEATRLINTLFFRPSEEDLAIIQSKMHGVRNWMEVGGRTNNGQNRRRPFLFCGDKWRVRETMSTQMKDASGNPMFKENGEPYLIKDSREIRNRRKEAAQEWNKDPNTGVRPLWLTSSIKKYAEDPTLGPCTNVDGVVAFTFNEGSFGAITLCIDHKYFKAGRLRSVEASALPSKLFENNQPPSNKDEVQSISKVVPAGRIAYHELFHLYWGSEMDGVEEYDSQRMAGNKLRKNGKRFTKSKAMKNPETYALAAVAYDYTLHVTHTTKKGTYPVEFYTGFCTYEM